MRAPYLPCIDGKLSNNSTRMYTQNGHAIEPHNVYLMCKTNQLIYWSGFISFVSLALLCQTVNPHTHTLSACARRDGIHIHHLFLALVSAIFCKLGRFRPNENHYAHAASLQNRMFVCVSVSTVGLRCSAARALRLARALACPCSTFAIYLLQFICPV